MRPEFDSESILFALAAVRDRTDRLEARLRQIGDRPVPSLNRERATAQRTLETLSAIYLEMPT